MQQLTKIKINFADNQIVKDCKLQGNKILNSTLVECTAWRIDFNDVFEKFVQYIFNEMSKET